MIYESVIKEKTLEDNFYKRMSLYLKSKSIDEYCVKRDLLNINDSLIDEFWLWYMYKEKKHVLVGYWLLSMIGVFALILFAPPLILGGKTLCVVSSTLAIISFVLVFPTLPVIATTGISYRLLLYFAISYNAFKVS